MVLLVSSSTRVVADVAIVQPDGSVKLVESMFSSKVDLTGPAPAVAARIHPSKAAAFLAALEERDERHVTVAAGLPPGAYRVDPAIEIHVNGPKGIVKRQFSELAGPVRELIEKGTCAGVTGTVRIDGFDPGHEPVVRLQQDRCTLVFAALPPLTIQTDHARAARFDLDRFGAELIARLAVPCTWDDRDVFVIEAPGTSVMETLRGYLGSYWDVAPRDGGRQGLWSRLLGRKR